MTTFGDLVNQVKSLLRSYTGVQEQATWLIATCDTDDLALSVDNSDHISIGVSEIDEELVFVNISDANVLQVPPWGRGYNGSVAASHAVNAPVVFDPLFPVVEVKRAINQTLQATYPSLFQVKSTTFDFVGAQATYELPADCDKVLKVTYSASGPSNYWPTISRWEFEQNSEEASGKALTLHEIPEQNRTVKVIYQAGFSDFTTNADTLTGRGFPESAVDVLLYGACAKLVRFLDLGRLQLTNVENMSRGQLVGANDAGKIANQLYTMYQLRLEEERRKLLDNDQPQMFFTR